MKLPSINFEAIEKYNQAMLLGNKQRDKAIDKVKEGIACFDSLDDALADAEYHIQRYTKSDFMMARFYDVVVAEIRKLQ